MQKKYILHNGRKIWYAMYGGSQSGTPLLVIHGGPGFLSMPQIIKDFSSKRPVIFYDQLGCGNSDRAPDTSYYSIENYVNELAEVRRQLRLDKVFLLGFSWGSALACSYLLQRRPDGVAGLILSGPCLSASRWDKDQRENIAAMPVEIKDYIVEGEKNSDYGVLYQTAMSAYYRKHLCRLKIWPDYLKDAVDNLSLDVYTTLWGPSEFTITGSLKDFDLMPRLKEIEVPVLLTCGDRDEAGVKTVKDYQMAFKNANMAVIPNASQLHHLEQPAVYKLIVNQFMEQIQPTPKNLD
jgi:proline iminopeptidase